MSPESEKAPGEGSSDIALPPRALMIGCTSFLGVGSIEWGSEIPNIRDYPLVFVSVPHITEAFLESVDSKYLETLNAR